jgi:hypothetical protein
MVLLRLDESFLQHRGILRVYKVTMMLFDVVAGCSGPLILYLGHVMYW